MKPDSATDVQLPHLETFAQAAELSSFTAAARVLGLSQAAVSQRVQAIEKTLGVSLFRREGGRVLLTEAGRRLHQYARRILELHQEARAALVGRRPPLAGELRLGASSVPGEHLLPALLADFHQRYPDIKVFADISDSLTVIQQVERGKVQLGLVGRKTDNADLEYRPFTEDRMVLVAPAQHAWAKRRSVPLKQLCRQPLVLREAGSGLRHCFEKALEMQGKSLSELRVVLELGSNEAIKEAVLRGLGLAVLSTFAVQKELQTGQLAALIVTDLHCDRCIYTVRDRRRVLSAPAQVFLTFLETHPWPAASS